MRTTQQSDFITFKLSGYELKTLNTKYALQSPSTNL